MQFEMTARVNLDDEKVIALVIDLIGDLLKEEMDCEIIDLPTLDEDYQKNLINRCINYEVVRLCTEYDFCDYYLDRVALSFNNDVMKLEEICTYYYDVILNKLEEMCEQVRGFPHLSLFGGASTSPDAPHFLSIDKL